MQTLHLLCIFFDLVSVSISWVLWCEHKTVRNQFFVLFRRYNKTIVNDIFRIATKRKIAITKKIDAAGNSLIIGNVCGSNCYKSRSTYSQGYLYGKTTFPRISSIHDI